MISNKLRGLFAPVALAFGLATTTPLSAATPLGLDDDEESQKSQDEDGAEPEDAEEEWFAVHGGDVHVPGGGVLRGATVLGKDGKIDAIGYDLFLPEGTRELDASGYDVYPGFVAYESSSRVFKGSVPRMPFAEEEEAPLTAPEEEVDPHPFERLAERLLSSDDEYDEDELDEAFDDPTEAARDLDDSFDPFSSDLVLALASGITTVGQNGAAVKLKRYQISGVGLDARDVVGLSYGSASARRTLRERLATAAAYLRAYRQWENDKKDDDELQEPSDKGVHKPTLNVLTGDARGKFSATSREELLGIARLAQQYDFRPLIEGCIEGWTVADELGRAGAIAVVTPRTRRQRDERLVRDGGSTIENARILHAAGVQVAVIPSNTSIDLGGIAGRDLMHLPIEAAFAVRGGLSEEAALESITLVAARALGVDHRVGSLEVGKDMDLIVTDGDPLHYETFVQYTVVEGRLVYDKQRELFFAHIRPRPEPAVPEPTVEPEEDEDDDAEAEGDEDETDEDETDEDETDDADEEEDADDDAEEESSDDGRARADIPRASSNPF